MSNEHHHEAVKGDYIPETYIPHPETHGTKTLWKVFFILLFITIIDFIIYFQFEPSIYKNIVFVALGIVKAILIVGIFMHLTYEATFLRWMIALPAAIFISYFAWLLLLEGNFVSTY